MRYPPNPCAMPCAKTMKRLLSSRPTPLTGTTPRPLRLWHCRQRFPPHTVLPSARGKGENAGFTARNCPAIPRPAPRLYDACARKFYFPRPHRHVSKRHTLPLHTHAFCPPCFHNGAGRATARDSHELFSKTIRQQRTRCDEISQNRRADQRLGSGVSETYRRRTTRQNRCVQGTLRGEYHQARRIRNPARTGARGYCVRQLAK